MTPITRDTIEQIHSLDFKKYAARYINIENLTLSNIESFSLTFLQNTELEQKNKNI